MGHFWLTSLTDIQHGNRCPYCSGRAPKTEIDYYKLASKKNIKYETIKVGDLVFNKEDVENALKNLKPIS